MFLSVVALCPQTRQQHKTIIEMNGGQVKANSQPDGSHVAFKSGPHHRWNPIVQQGLLPDTLRKIFNFGQFLESTAPTYYLF
jgi:hypothetical protein